MARKPRLTDEDWATIRRALNDAMDERDSYADAWPKGTPERDAALKNVARYERLHRKLFGDASARQKQNEEYAAMPTMTMMEFVAHTLKEPRS